MRLALPALLYFAEEVEAAQHEAIEQLGEPAVGLVAWAGPRRKILGEQPEQLLEAMDPAWRAVAGRLLEAWNQAVRASSVVVIGWHHEGGTWATLPCNAAACPNRLSIGWRSWAMPLLLPDRSHCQVLLNLALPIYLHQVGAYCSI